MIKLANRVKRFGDATVLDGIDLEIDQGEIIVVIGPGRSLRASAWPPSPPLGPPESGLAPGGLGGIMKAQTDRSDIP